MYRRRRNVREPIAFSFDSFLDVVANVIGIIVRLILVAWVGARSYSAAMQQHDDPSHKPPELAAPAPADDPAYTEVERVRRKLEEARRLLLERLGNLGLVEQRSAQSRQELASLERQR